MTPNGDGKKTERVPVWFDDQTLLDLTREANRVDRKLSDFIRHVCRLYLYGHRRENDSAREGPESAD